MDQINAFINISALIVLSLVALYCYIVDIGMSFDFSVEKELTSCCLVRNIDPFPFSISKCVLKP